MKRPLLVGLVLAMLLSAMPLAALASPVEASANPSGSQCVYHWVQPGETLSGIAARYGVNMWTLAQRNGITNPNRIYAGTRLLIYCPAPPPHPKPPPKPQPPYPPQPQPIPPGPCSPPGCGPYVPPPSQPGDGSSACSIQPQNGFGSVWYHNASVRQQLGCPTTGEQGFSGSQQFFRNGFAVDTGGIIYVFYNNGTWEQHQNTWTSGDPVYNPSLVPPPGWCQPEYGIGKVWRNVDNVSQRLGWAKHPAQATNGTTQQYQGGMMLWTASGGVYVMVNNGTYQAFH